MTRFKIILYKFFLSLPTLNSNLKILYCYHNNLTSLPILNYTLK
jgi:Leucine-rich repeat (LRR) protein